MTFQEKTTQDYIEDQIFPLNEIYNKLTMSVNDRICDTNSTPHQIQNIFTEIKPCDNKWNHPFIFFDYSKVFCSDSMVANKSEEVIELKTQTHDTSIQLPL